MIFISANKFKNSQINLTESVHLGLPWPFSVFQYQATANHNALSKQSIVTFFTNRTLHDLLASAEMLSNTSEFSYHTPREGRNSHRSRTAGLLTLKCTLPITLLQQLSISFI